jgi:hypothetical protein
MNQQTTIENLQPNPVPIGFIYVQLPKEKSPSEIWPRMTWIDVSSTYAGVFFRVTGGGAESFGKVQEDNAPLITEVTKMVDKTDKTSILIQKGASSQYLTTGGWDYCNNKVNINFRMSGGEVRPRNMAIRIWKRTG